MLTYDRGAPGTLRQNGKYTPVICEIMIVRRSELNVNLRKEQKIQLNKHVFHIWTSLQPVDGGSLSRSGNKDGKRGPRSPEKRFQDPSIWTEGTIQSKMERTTYENELRMSAFTNTIS